MADNSGSVEAELTLQDKFLPKRTSSISFENAEFKSSEDFAVCLKIKDITTEEEFNALLTEFQSLTFSNNPVAVCERLEPKIAIKMCEAAIRKALVKGSLP
jgi:hypothetical protein